MRKKAAANVTKISGNAQASAAWEFQKTRRGHKFVGFVSASVLVGAVVSSVLVTTALRLVNPVPPDRACKTPDKANTPVPEINAKQVELPRGGKCPWLLVEGPSEAIGLCYRNGNESPVRMTVNLITPQCEVFAEVEGPGGKGWFQGKLSGRELGDALLDGTYGFYNAPGAGSASFDVGSNGRFRVGYYSGTSVVNGHSTAGTMLFPG